MTAALTRTAIVQDAVQRGIAEYILQTFPLVGSDEEFDQARTALMGWAKLAAPHIAACVEEDLRRAMAQQRSVIGDLLGMVGDTLEWGFVPLAEETPYQESSVETTHIGRKTVAIVLAESGQTSRQIADQLRHSNIQTTEQHYIERGLANPAAAAVLDAAHRSHLTAIRPMPGR